jgi:hypothetical protein
MEIGSVEEDEDVKVGGVWAIAQVKAEVEQEDWKVVLRKARAGKQKFKPEGRVKPASIEDSKCGKDQLGERSTKEINAVLLENRRLMSLGRGEITVDSAAEESFCPEEWGGSIRGGGA